MRGCLIHQHHLSLQVESLAAGVGLRHIMLNMQSLLDDESKVARYKAEASDYICSKYNWDHVVDETLRLYRR